VLFSSISIYADQTVQGDFFFRDVVVNGEKIVNYNLQYPFMTYNNTTYLPLSADLGRICGFTPEVDWESRTLKLVKTEPTQKNLSNNTYKGDNLTVAVQALTDMKVLAVEEKTVEATEDEGEVEAEADATETIVEELVISEATPLLAKGKYIYIPVRVFADSEIFNWDLFYDSYFGISISSSQEIPAKDYWNEELSLYNKGLYAYIKQYNWGLPGAYAQKLTFLFKRAGEVYKIDEKLLMAVAHKESTFNANAVSRMGATGIMQIMPATGARYGLTQQQLKDPQISINVGAMILSERIAAYGGDVVKGLSAYNQGSVPVNRGSYSTSYASRVLSAQSGVNNFLTTNGYVVK
jgi:hypothetical protein